MERPASMVTANHICRRRSNPRQWQYLASLRSLLTIFLLILLGPSAGCTKAARAARHAARGDKYFHAEQYDHAEIEYLNVLRQTPAAPQAIRRLGLIYYAEGRLPQALRFLRQAVNLEPDDSELALKLARTCLSLQFTKDARQTASAVLQKHPANEEGLILVAACAMTTNEVKETWQRIEALPPAAKAMAGYHVARGTLLSRQQDLAQAQAEFKLALAQDPKSIPSHLALSRFCLLSNDLEQAESHLKAAADLSPLRSPERLGYAEFKLKTGAGAEGRRIVEDVTRKAPDYLPAWLFLAETEFAERRFPQCADYLARARARDPANYQGLMLSGRLAMAKGQATNAIAQFERVASLYGQGPQAEHALALAHLLNRNPAKAIACLNQAISAAPNFAEAILLLAEINLRQGDPGPAISSLTALLKQQPHVPQAYLLLADAYAAQNHPDESVAVLRRMLAVFPKNPSVPLWLGNALLRQNRNADARQAFEQSLTLAPDYPPVVERMIDLDLAEKQYAAALRRSQQLREKKPKAPESWLLSAKIHLAQAMDYVAQEKQKQPGAAHARFTLAQVPAAQPEAKEAETALRKALELDPNNRAAPLVLARILMMSDKPQAALAALNGLLSKTNDEAALMFVASIHLQTTNYPAARDAFEKVLSLNPNSAAALNDLANLYCVRFGDPDRAGQLAEKARQLEPSNPAIADTLGWILYQRGQYSRSLELFQESAARLTADPEVSLHLGLAHYMMGQEDPARRALQQAAQASQDFPEKRQATNCLTILAIDAKTAGPPAMAVLKEALRKNPKDPVALSRLGAVQERDGAFDQALQTYQTALKLNPANEQLMLSIAQLYSGPLKDPQRALDFAKEAHSRAPDNPRISQALGRLAFQRGEFAWAASLLEESLRKLPDDRDLWFDLAWSRYSLGRVADAEAAMTNVVHAGARFPKLDEAKRFLDLGAAARDPALAPQAEAQARAILSADPDYVPALLVCALAQEQGRNYKEAGQLYERILSRFPRFSPALRNLALLCAEPLGDEPRAYTLAAQAREALPQDPDIARTLGTLACRRGDYSRAIQLLKEAALKRDHDAELLYYLGLAHYHLNERREAKAALEQALALNVQPKFAEQTRRLLAELKAAEGRN